MAADGIEGSGSWLDGEIAKLGGRVIPADPAQLAPPPVACPLKLSRHDDEDFQLAELLRVYKRVTWERTAQESHAYARGKVPDSMRTRALAGAALLIEGAIPPAAWCVASFDQFESMTSSNRPRPAWVWSAKRIAPESKTRVWYEERRESYEGPRQVTVPEFDLLRRDWLRMWQALRAQRPLIAETTIAATVARYFPGNSFDTRLQKARAAFSELARLRSVEARSLA